MTVTSSIIHFLSSGFILSSGGDEFWLGWGGVSRSTLPVKADCVAYAPDFFLRDDQPWWCFEKSEKLNRVALIRVLEVFLKETDSQKWDSPQIQWEKPSFPFFKDRFDELQTQFRAGILKKAVPVLFEKAELVVSARLKAEWLLQLLSYSLQLPVHLYGLWNKEEGILGATPELLFQIEGRILQTAALAGTRLKDGSLSSHLSSLLKDPKELEEHRIVIEGIASSLSPFGKLQRGKTRELDLPTLVHLFTPMTLELEGQFQEQRPDLLFQDVVRHLHPTPALGAFPRGSGMSWLRDYQNYVKRYRFGAPFGALWKSGESRCVVAIRNLQWNSEGVLLGAGCGIISQSQLEKEWLEIQGKMASVKKMFGLSFNQVIA